MQPVDAAPEIDAPVGGAQCSDGIDNDGDGKVDFPADPGCLAPQQDTETDDCPSGPHCPQCANGIDDDGNGSTDYPADPGCSAASDPVEFIDNPVACGAGLMIKQLPGTGTDSGTLDTTSVSDVASNGCGGGSSSPAIAYQIALTAPKVMVANTSGSDVDTVLDLRGAMCPTDEIECHNDISGTDKSSKITRSLAAGTYYLIVEGHDSNAQGAYALDVRFFTGEGEACTDTTQCGPGLVCRAPLGQTAKVCSKPMCSDGVDDDNDTKADYPDDPGCANPSDNDETDPDPLPACSDGMDNDNDGKTDYPMDTSCTSAAGGSEACQGEQDPIDNIVAGTTSGTLVGTHDDHNPSCGSDGGGDVLYTVNLPAMRSIVFDTEGTAADTLLSLLTATCAEPSLGCDDDGGTSGNSSRLQFTNLNAGTYIVAVDMYNGTKPAAPFDLHITGVISPGGSCDPVATLGGALACPASNPCGAGPNGMICLPSACGDGMDNDGDGKMDFPADPGCSSLDDTDESDSCASGPGPGCPECADGIDNDGDGQMDYPNDTSCLSPSGQSEGCLTTDGVTPLTQPSTADTNVGAHDDIHLACGSSSNSAPDKTYSLQLPPLRNLSIVNTNSFDEAIALFDSTCGGMALVCHDEPEDISMINVPAGLYFYVVDGWSSGTGPYTINISGTIQNSASCESPLAQSGALVCASGFSCSGTPGSRTCRPAPCNDGIDNDGDGVGDYPNDPGCASPSDTDETDNCPGGAGCPACADGLDNDGDLLIDYPDDPGCATASSTAEGCTTSEIVSPLVAPLTGDTTSNAINDNTPSCSTSSTAPDKVYSMTVPAVTNLTVRTTSSGFTAATSLYDSTCGGTPVKCVTTQPMTLATLAAGTYYFSVDGTSSTSGPYTISVTGKIVNGESCESPLAVSGALTCNTGYACKGTMGSRTCTVAVCNDGMDDDLDGKPDYPNDPGCDSPSDDDETDPAIPPICSDGMDNDNDGATDYPDDFGCAAASSPTEEPCTSTEGVTTLTMAMTMDTTVGATNDASPACSSTTNTAPDKVYALQIPDVTSLSIVNTNGFDAVVSLLDSTCGGTPVACSDTPEDLTFGALAGGHYYYVVDGWGSTAGNTYTITVSGTIANGASCESPLAQAGALTCGPAYACLGTPGSRTCSPAICSDGMDNDGDGKMDYPADPGCSSPSDNDETDPATAPACANGSDDNANGFMDWPADFGCAAAGDTSEEPCEPETDPVTNITTTPVTGTTVGLTSDFATSTCVTNASGPDVAYGLYLPVPVASLVLDLAGSSFDTILSLRDARCGMTSGCDDDGNGTTTHTSKLTVSNVAAGGYSILVDGYNSLSGTYSLSIKGTVATGTDCTSPLFASGVLVCPTGTTCTGTPATCH